MSIMVVEVGSAIMKRWFFGLALLTVADCAAAGDHQLAAWSRANVHTVAGRVDGCGISFTTVFKDATYRGGKVSGVDSTMTWMRTKDGMMGMMFKIMVMDWSGTEPIGPPSAVAISDVYVRAGKLVKFAEEMPCENPPAECRIAPAGVAIDALTASLAGPIQVGFNRTAGGLDIPLDVPNLDADEFGKFAQCSLDMMEQMKQR